MLYQELIERKRERREGERKRERGEGDSTVHPVTHLSKNGVSIIGHHNTAHWIHQHLQSHIPIHSYLIQPYTHTLSMALGPRHVRITSATAYTMEYEVKRKCRCYCKRVTFAAWMFPTCVFFPDSLFVL